MNTRTKLLLVQLAMVAGVCAFFFFYGLGAFGLVGADEPRYAQIAREMFARHDWIVPTLNGQPWLEKPVLLYWREMEAFAVLGVKDWVARTPSAIFASTMVLAVFFFMRRFRYGSELDAALITASCAGVLGFARAASTDMLLSAPFCLALLAWWAWHQTDRKLWLGAFYGLLGFGMLAKGPLAPGLAVLIVAAYAGLRRDGKVFTRSLWLPGFAIFAAIVLPWYIAIQVKVPTFFRTFFLEHNLERFGTNLYRHSQPFWYYIPVLLLAVMPWTVFTVPALIDGVRNAWSRLRTGEASAASEAAAPEQDAATDWLAHFLLLWTLVPIVFFSISRSKLPGYILPAIPAATMLTALHMHRIQAIARIKLMLHSLVCGALVVLAMLAPWRLMRQAVPDPSKTYISIMAGAVAIMVLLLVRRGGLRVLHFATLVPMVLALAFLLKPAAPVIDQTQSARAVDAELRKLGVTAAPLAVFDVKKQRELAYGLNFYHGQPVTYYEAEAPLDLPHGIPAEQHVVITKTGNGDAVRAAVGQRNVKSLGAFAPQHLEFFEVAAR